MIPLTPIGAVIAVAAFLIFFLGYFYFTAGTTVYANPNPNEPEVNEIQTRESSLTITPPVAFVSTDRRVPTSNSERRSIFTR